MSETHRKRLATIYDAFSAGDVDTVMASLTDDIEWRVHRPSPVAGTYTGRDAVLDFFSRMMAAYEGTLSVEVETIAADDRVGFVKVRESADRPGAGVAYTGVHVWEFRDDRCSRFESYYDGNYFDFWTG
jgi:ketosteroid isomerase-like protein